MPGTEEVTEPLTAILTEISDLDDRMGRNCERIEAIKADNANLQARRDELCSRGSKAMGKAPTGVMIDAPAPEPVVMPPMADMGYCDCPTCRALADAPVELADDAPAYRVRSIQDWIAGGGLLRGEPDLRVVRDWMAAGMSGAAVTQAVDGAEAEACGAGVNGYHAEVDC